MPGSHGGSPRVEASPHRNRTKIDDQLIHSFIHSLLNKSVKPSVDGVLLASESMTSPS